MVYVEFCPPDSVATRIHDTSAQLINFKKVAGSPVSGTLSKKLLQGALKLAKRDRFLENSQFRVMKFRHLFGNRG